MQGTLVPSRPLGPFHQEPSESNHAHDSGIMNDPEKQVAEPCRSRTDVIHSLVE